MTKKIVHKTKKSTGTKHKIVKHKSNRHKAIKHEIKHTLKKEHKHSTKHMAKTLIKKIGRTIKKADVKKADKHSTKVVHKLFSKKFCPKCGGKIEGDATLCHKCHKIDFDFKEINILLCNNCGSYNYKNKWQKLNDINEAMEIILNECIKHHFEYIGVDDNQIETLKSYKAGVHKDFTVTINIGTEQFDLPATVDVTLCPKCSKQGTKYFEGILQVRNATAEIIQFIKNDIIKNKSKGVHINKEVTIDGTEDNIDYYYSDKRHLKVIAEKLREQFGATIKQNAQLFSIDWETSKNIYRLNVLVEFPKYHKNDVIKVDNQLYKIISMDEKVHVLNLKTNSKTLLPHNEYDILKPVEMMVIKKYPEYTVLDPNTYYQARLLNPVDTLQISQKIKAIIDGGEAWMISE